MHSHQFTDWASAEDYTHLQKMLTLSDCILVGNNTYETAKTPLSKHNCVVLSKKYDKGIKQLGDNIRYCNPSFIDIKQYFEQSLWQNIYILGGTQTYRLALSLQMIHEIYITIEPLLFTQGLNLFDSLSSKGHASPPGIILCKLKNHTKLNKRGSLLLHYSIEYT